MSKLANVNRFNQQGEPPGKCVWFTKKKKERKRDGKTLNLTLPCNFAVRP